MHAMKSMDSAFDYAIVHTTQHSLPYVLGHGIHAVVMADIAAPRSTGISLRGARAPQRSRYEQIEH